MKNNKLYLIIIFLLLLIIIIIFCIKYRKNRLESFYQTNPDSSTQQPLIRTYCSKGSTYTDPFTEIKFTCNNKYNKYNSGEYDSCPTYLVKNSHGVCDHPQTMLSKDLCDSLLDGQTNFINFMKSNNIDNFRGQYDPATMESLSDDDPRKVKDFYNFGKILVALGQSKNKLNCPKGQITNNKKSLIRAYCSKGSTYTDPITKIKFTCNDKYKKYNSNENGFCPTYFIKNSQGVCDYPQTMTTQDLCNTILDGKKNFTTFTESNHIILDGQLDPDTAEPLSDDDPRKMKDLINLMNTAQELTNVNNKLNCPKKTF